MITRSRPNFTLLLITAALLLPCIGGALLVQRWQLIRMSETLLEFAHREEDQKRWFKAADHLKAYLRIHPLDAQVQSRLALDWVRGARTHEDCEHGIELCYRALAHQHPAQEVGVRSCLAEQLLKLNRLLEAEGEANNILREQPENPLAQRVKALALFTQFQNGVLNASDKRRQTLMQDVERARRLNLTNVALAEAAATMYRNYPELVKLELSAISEDERSQLADTCLDDLVQGAATDPAAWLARYQYRQQHRLPNAEADLRKALQLAPADRKVVLSAGQAALQQAEEHFANGSNAQAIEKYSEARKLFVTIVTNKRESARVEHYLGSGDSLRGLGAFSEALAAWHRGLEECKEPYMQVQLHARIADCLIEQGELQQAAKSISDIDRLLDRLGASVTNNQRVNLRRSQSLRKGVWHLFRYEPLEAIALLQQVVALGGTSDTHERAVLGFAWKMLGQAYGMLDEWDEAAVAFDRAQAAKPDDTLARLAAAQAWLRAGRADLAADRAEMAVATNATGDAWFMLAVSHLCLQSRHSPHERSWHRFEESISALEEMPISRAQSWRTIILRAEYLALRPDNDTSDASQIEQAADLLEQGKTRYTDIANYWIHSILLFERLELPAYADQTLQEMTRHGHAQHHITIATARLAALRKNYDVACQTIEQAKRRTSRSDDQHLNRALLRVAEQSGNRDRLYSLLVDELTLHPNDVTAVRCLASIDLARRDFEKLVLWEQRLSKAGPVGEFWAQYYSAWRHLQAASPSNGRALQRVLEEHETLAAARPTFPGLFILQGMIEHRLGKYDKAATAFEQAIKTGAANRDVYEQYVEAHGKHVRIVENAQYRLPVQTNGATKSFSTDDEIATP